MTASPAFAANRKFHPGHYYWPSGTRWSAEDQAAHFAELDDVAANAKVKGIQIGFNWNFFEGARGDYSRGFRIVDAYLDKLDTLPTDKYLMVRLNTRTFGSTVNTGAYPPYVVNNGWVASRPPGEEWSGNLATAAKAWQPEVMDRLIALSRAFAARYNTHPRFETFALGETALGVPTEHGFRAEAWRTQLQRWFTESKKVWTNTFLRLTANYLRNETSMRGLITHCVNTVTPDRHARRRDDRRGRSGIAAA